MTRALLEWLCCPECEGTVDLQVLQAADDGSIDEGVLRCAGCARVFPIVNGIPRMLPDALAHETLRHHREFFTKHRGEMEPFLARAGRSLSDEWWDAEQRTITSYSYQWRKFKQMFPHWQQVFLDSIAPVTPDFFPGKVGLDGGCGFGRSLYYAATYGASMIGLDLSEAIEAARENTRHLPNVHLVQGDIFHPPVRRRSLDFVYSIGVLHHLPDPKGGFLSLTRLLKPGAPMFIWVYLRGRGRQIGVFNVMRAISTRLPLRLLNVICLALAAAQWIGWLLPYRALRRFGPTRRLAARMPFTVYSAYPFRVLHTDWFDGLSVPLVNYYKPEAIAGWYREAGQQRVRIEDERHWNGRALGYSPGE
jgi:SAM-dependent methyltransferase